MLACPIGHMMSHVTASIAHVLWQLMESAGGFDFCIRAIGYPKTGSRWDSWVMLSAKMAQIWGNLDIAVNFGPSTNLALRSPSLSLSSPGFTFRDMLKRLKVWKLNTSYSETTSFIFFPDSSAMVQMDMAQKLVPAWVSLAINGNYYLSSKVKNPPGQFERAQG